MMSEAEDGTKLPAAAAAEEVRRGARKKKRPRGPPTEAERQFAAAAVQVMSGGATPEAQHAFLLLHPRLLPSTPSSPSSARRATRRLFQLWLRELTATIGAPGQQTSADDLLKRQSLLSFIHVWAKHFHGDLSPSRCSSAIKLLSLVLAPSHSASTTTPPLSPSSSSSSPSMQSSADGAAPSQPSSPKRRPSLNDEHRRMLNEFKLLFLQHRGAARSVAERLLESGAGTSPPLSPALSSRASVSLVSSPSLHNASSVPLASTPLLHSSASSVPALRSSTSPRARHSVAVSSIAAAAEDMGDTAYSASLQSRSAEMPVVASVDKGSKGRLYTSDESNLASGSHHQDGAEGKTSPRDTTSGDASDGSDEHSATAKEGGRRRVGRNSAHVRSDSVGAILSITQRPGGRRTPRLRFLDVPLEILAEEMSAHEIRLMHAVGPREFLDQGWQKNVELNMAPNITAIIDRFNQVSFWTTTEVLTKDTPQLMAKTIKRFIKLAGLFHEMNNFNSLVEIVSGLNSAAIQRLTVWKELPDKYARRFREMDALMQMKQNYRSYRERLAELLPFLAGSSSPASSPMGSSLQTSLSLSLASVTSPASSPSLPTSLASSSKKGSAGKVVPYFAVFLRDVTFAMVGNPLYLPPPQKSSTPTRPRRRLSESDADAAKDGTDGNAVEQESEEEDTDTQARGRETPIEGGTINMDRVQLMYDQVQTFQLLRHEMRGYEFLERVKREKEDKEFLRRLIREYQADLRAITNADLLYDLSLAAEGNALAPNALSTSPSSSSSAQRSTARLSMAPSPPPPPTTLRSSTSPRSSPSSDLRSSASSTSTRQALPSLVSAFSSLASSSSASVGSPNSRTHRLSMSMSLSPPLSPASSSPVVSSSYLRGSSGTIRVRSASDDAGAAVDIDTGDDDSDDDDDTDEEAFFLEIEAKQQQPAVTPKQSAKATTRKSRLRRKDVLSMRRVASSPDNNNNNGGDESSATGLLQHKQPEEKPAAAKRSGSRNSLWRRNSEPEAEQSAIPTLDSSLDAFPSGNDELFTSGSSVSTTRPLSPSTTPASSTSSSSSSPSPSTSKGSSRREFTFHKGKANISDGDLVSKVAVEVRSFVGNVSRPLLLTFRDTLDDFLAKAGLRHDQAPVVSFIYEAPSTRTSSSSGSSSAVVATTAPSLAAAVAGATGRKGEKLVVEDDEGFQTFKRWALQQSERSTIDVWLFVGVY